MRTTTTFKTLDDLTAALLENWRSLRQQFKVAAENYAENTLDDQTNAPGQFFREELEKARHAFNGNVRHDVDLYRLDHELSASLKVQVNERARASSRTFLKWAQSHSDDAMLENWDYCDTDQNMRQAFERWLTRPDCLI